MPALLTLKIDRIFFRTLTSNTRKFEDMGRRQTERRIALSHQDGDKRDDIFERLLAARDQETKQSLSALELNAEAISLIIAGMILLGLSSPTISCDLTLPQDQKLWHQ